MSKQDDGPWIVIAVKDNEVHDAGVLVFQGFDDAKLWYDTCHNQLNSIATIIPVKQALASKALLQACKDALSPFIPVATIDKQLEAAIALTE